ncbi:MAG: SHOCT domain-containing protein [Chloroflexi bacterium]|nr:SHOCT domain-containing protein [Chloroflexota bacterium]
MGEGIEDATTDTFAADSPMGASREDSALEILKRRYARGDISKEEYEEKKRDLL